MSNTAFAPDVFADQIPDGRRAHQWLAIQALRTVAAAHQERMTGGACRTAGTGKAATAFSCKAANDSGPLRDR